ncbi:MAG: hypothetical protein GY780_04185 [bacterium]|nr:hypothetical protein [bacterium]
MPRNLGFTRILPLYLLALCLPVSVSAISIAAGLVFLTALVVIAMDRQIIRNIPTTIWVVWLVLIVAYALSTAFSSPYPSNWGKWAEELWLKTLLVAIPIVVGSFRHHIPRILKVSFFVAFLTSFYGLWQHFYGVDLVRDRSLVTEFGHHEIVGFFSHKLSYGGQLLIYMLMGLAGLISEKTYKGRAFWLFGLLSMSLVLIWSHSRSPQLGVFAGGLLLFLLIKGRTRWLGSGLLASIILVSFFVPSVREHWLRSFSQDLNVTRMNLWESSWEGIKARPVLGFGGGNFEEMMKDFGVEGFYNTQAHSHNDFLMHGVNGGFLGILASAALLVMVGAIAHRVWKNNNRQAWIGLSTLAVIVGISTAGLFQVYQTDNEVEALFYFLLGCVVALWPNEKEPAG